ncbi:piccolo protein [Nymphaea thermarum]|nr:piccolo protein [Nymphaea thermarum]
MAAQKPVIACTSGGPVETIRHAASGFLCLGIGPGRRRAGPVCAGSGLNFCTIGLTFTEPGPARYLNGPGLVISFKPGPARPGPARPDWPVRGCCAAPSPPSPSPLQSPPLGQAHRRSITLSPLRLRHYRRQPGPARPGPAQPSPARPGPAQPGPARPSPARPGPAQPGSYWASVMVGPARYPARQIIGPGPALDLLKKYKIEDGKMRINMEKIADQKRHVTFFPKGNGRPRSSALLLLPPLPSYVSVTQESPLLSAILLLRKAMMEVTTTNDSSPSCMLEFMSSDMVEHQRELAAGRLDIDSYFTSNEVGELWGTGLPAPALHDDMKSHTDFEAQKSVQR